MPHNAVLGKSHRARLLEINRARAGINTETKTGLLEVDASHTDKEIQSVFTGRRRVV
ncbi:hypothetical protein [Veronia nyctiphanis]|uniref:hypothetical protein n=1 Tax=Veronia nyctiphanis TaxID=1278244 RepID=UPI0013757AD9|nr:hypothetical protein [Veronia nyctiphanis]